MGSTLSQKISGLSADRKAAVEARADEMVLEEVTLRAVRRGLNLTQSQVAALMNVDQTVVSRTESRCNMMVNTLERYMKALGARVSIVAEFDDRPPVKITLHQVAEDLRKAVS